MKTKFFCFSAMIFLTAACGAFAQGTAFTYQGRLNDGANPANGNYDLQFTICDALSGGSAVAGPGVVDDVAVSNGLFTVSLDFGSSPFSGADRWLNIAVRPGASSGSFTNLAPRQRITSTPYAIQAANAASAATASSVAAANITGTISLAHLPSTLVTNGSSGVSLSGTFSGDGSAVTNVRVSSLVQPQLPLVLWGAAALSTVPVGASDATAISLGYNHNLLLKSNGIVVAWGFNDAGQTNVPPGLTNVVEVAAGLGYSLALRGNGTVLGWGEGLIVPGGQTNIPPGVSNVVAISAGSYMAAALKSDGTVAVWGDNAYGETNIPAGLNTVKAISAGGAHMLALKTNGTVVAWGAGTTNDPPSNPYNYGQSIVPPGLSNVVAVSAGFIHSLALMADGTVAAWGAGTANATNSVDLGQSIVPPGLSNVVAIAAGYFHSLALKADGTVVAWGAGTTNDPPSPYNNGQSIVPPGLNGAVAISAGVAVSGALAPNAWTPAQIPLLTANNVFQGSIAAASFTGDGSGLTNLNASQLTSGTVPNGRIAGFYDQTVTFFNDTNTFKGTFIGNGFNISSLNASALQIGTVPGAVLTGNYFGPINFFNFDNNYWGSFSGNGGGLTDLNASQFTAGTLPGSTLAGTYGNAVTLNNAANSFTGSGGGLTSLNASQLTSGTVADARLSANVPLLSGGKLSDSVLSTNVALRSGSNVFSGAQQVTGLLSVGGGIGSLNSSNRFDFNASYPDVTLTVRKRVGDNYALAVQDSGATNRLLVTAGGVTMAGNVGIGAASPMKALQVGDSAIGGSEGMIHLASRSPNSGAARDWQIGVPQTTNDTTGVGYSFIVHDVGLGAAAPAQLMVQFNTGNVGIGTNAPQQRLHVVGNILATGTVTGSSDRNVKRDFAPVNSREVLDKVTALPISTWSYIADDAVRHLGPMAQDFYSAFSVGMNDKTISMVDADGVALAAIQGLNAKVESGKQKAETSIQELKAENAELNARLEKLERLMNNKLNGGVK